MGSAGRRGLAWLALVALAAGAPAEESLPPVTQPPVEAAAPADAPPTLELRLDFEPPHRLQLFPSPTGAGGFDADRLYQFAALPSEAPSPGLDVPVPLTLEPVLVFDPAEPGKTDLRLFRFDRKTWDELDTWEKIGLVTSYASAVAGAVGLVAAALD